MKSETQIVRRILTIDDNDAIHVDFRKILVGTAAPAKLSLAKTAIFGDAAAAPDKVRFEVDSALQGEQGLAALQEAVKQGKPYSVAFVDMRMPPGWDGLQTIQRLWEADEDLQVVICSAYSDYTWEEITEKLGLTDRLLILKKPFDPAEVTQLAAALSEKWALRRAAKLKMEELESMVKERTSELAHQASHDKLTGLPNRTLINERLEKVVQRAQRDIAYKYAVLFLDFDRFKLINDSFGHESGDALLHQIGERLSAAITLAGKAVGNAMAARIGGDEFVIVIDELADFTDATTFAEGLLRLLNTAYTVGDRNVHSTASIGVTTSELCYDRAADAIRDADTAMYRAKSAGKARCVYFDRSMHEEVIRRIEMENELHGAAERGELFLNYQPIVSLSNGQIYGFEALVRWNRPGHGLVPPNEFIPCCEETGLIKPIGAWILSQACSQLQEWKKKYPQYRDMMITVNISAVQIQPQLVTLVDEILQKTGLDPASLALEITETVLVKDAAGAGDILRDLRALGVRMLVDDFGTGYSSLSSLHQFPLDGIKIDRAFMKNVNERRDYAAVVNAIVNLARNLGMKLIAEGIETADQVTLLQAMDCDLAQGYFFERPMDPKAVDAYITRQLASSIAA